MKYVDEFRDPVAVRRWADALARKTSRPWSIMEICGGQTHNIIKFGIDGLLPESIQLIHGPGCPVCVTPVAMIDAAVRLASQPKTILCSFGDMMRVPGSTDSLLTARAGGADVRVIYSPHDAVEIAASNPEQEVVFFAVGFETTAPANAAAVAEAMRRNLNNFSMIVSHVLVKPAIETILSAPDCIVQGFLTAGHVCSITGYEDYFELANKFLVPMVVTGFEPIDILQGVYLCIEQLESGTTEVVNQYQRSVKPQGNLAARALINDIFEVCDREWRGIGLIPKSGYRLRPHLSRFDALARSGMDEAHGKEDPACLAGQVLQGKLKPTDCPAFGVRCRPETPLGAPMVSNEGACAAYYLYKQRRPADA